MYEKMNGQKNKPHKRRKKNRVQESIGYNSNEIDE